MGEIGLLILGLIYRFKGILIIFSSVLLAEWFADIRGYSSFERALIITLLIISLVIIFLWLRWALFFRRHPAAYDLNDPRKIKTAIYAFMGEEIKPATYNIRRNYLKQFFAWGISEDIFEENPLDGLKKRKDEERGVNLDANTLSKL